MSADLSESWLNKKGPLKACCAALASALLSLSPAPAQSNQELAVTAVRSWALGGVTRIAVETTGDFTYRTDRLSNPERVYFDIVGAINRVGPKRHIQHTIPVADGIVRQIRVAESVDDATRIVLDLAGPVEVASSQLANPPRLMVELRLSAPVPPSVPDAAPPAPSLPAVSEALKEPAKEAPVRSTIIPATPRKMETAPIPVTNAKTVPDKPAPLPDVVAKNAPPPTKEADPSGVGLPAKRDSQGNRSLVRVLGLKIGRVIIDPGHGGHDTGTIGPSGIMEKDIVLDVAKRLSALIQDRLNSEVILTRTDDTFVPLEQRPAMANEKRADLFLSIHVNSSPARMAAGIETYYLNFSTSREDLEVAARENASSQKTVHELADLLQRIALKDKVEESREFASQIQSALFPVSATSNAKAKNRGVKKAPFVVLIGAAMPSVLAEIGFVSNAREESLLRKADHRQKIAEALYKGVATYAATLSHFNVAQRED